MEINDPIVVSFDLDFTLIDNREGIINSFHYAFNKFGITPVDPSRLEKTIGEPLLEVFGRLTDEEPEKLVDAFRDYYRKEGIYQVQLYDGVINVLTDLKEANMLLGVVTSKKRGLAVKLLKHLKIFHFFEFVHGETDSIKNKTDPHLKEYFNSHYPPSNYSYIIIGDHKSDKDLAEMLQCPFIGVLTGHQNGSLLKNGDKIHVKTLAHISELGTDIIESLVKREKKKSKKVK
jgi:phosphoglycolate phosphatase